MSLSVKCKQARKPEFDLRTHVRKKKYYKGGGRIWKDWEMWGIGVHDVKFTKSQ